MLTNDLILSADTFSAEIGSPGVVPAVMMHFLARVFFGERGPVKISDLREDERIVYHNGSFNILAEHQIQSGNISHESPIQNRHVRNLASHWRAGVREFDAEHLAQPAEDRSTLSDAMTPEQLQAFRAKLELSQNPPSHDTLAQVNLPEKTAGQILADHWAMERLCGQTLGWGFSKKVLLRHCGSRATERVVRRVLQRRRLLTFSRRRVGHGHRESWSVTEKGKALASTHDPTLDFNPDEDVRNRFEQLHVRPFEPAWASSESSRPHGNNAIPFGVIEELLADHRFVEEVVNGPLSDVASGLVLVWHGGHHNTARALRTALTELNLCMQCAQGFQITEIARELLRRSSIPPTLTEEQANLISAGNAFMHLPFTPYWKLHALPEAVEPTKPPPAADQPEPKTARTRTNDKVRKSPWNKVFADHLLLEEQNGGPIHTKVSIALIRHHFPNKKHHSVLRSNYKRSGVFDCVDSSGRPVNKRGARNTLWQLTEAGQARVNACAASPTLSDEEARAFLQRFAP